MYKTKVSNTKEIYKESHKTFFIILGKYQEPRKINEINNNKLKI